MEGMAKSLLDDMKTEVKEFFRYQDSIGIALFILTILLFIWVVQMILGIR